MKTLLHIPRINPIRFFDQRAGKNQREGDYVQKYSPFDRTNIQLASVGVMYDVLLTIENKYRKPVKTLTPSISVLGENNDRFFYTFNINFYGLAGLYRLVITGDAQNELPQKYISGILCISTDNEAITLLHYKNSINDNDINFDAIDMFSLRTEGGFLMKSDNPRSNNTIYQKQGGMFEMLHSVTYFTKIFTVGGAIGVPDDFFKIIHKAWGCDTVYVNGVQHVEHEGAQWNVNDEEGYEKRAWTLEVVENAGDSSGYGSDGFSALMVGIWNDYICQYNVPEPICGINLIGSEFVWSNNDFNLTNGDLNLVSGDFNLITQGAFIRKEFNLISKKFNLINCNNNE